MSTVLDQLFRLQDRVRFVQTRQRQRDTIPDELVEVDRDHREKVEAVSRIRQRLAAAQVEHRRAEAELDDQREKLKKYQGQLRNVQSSREYSAVLNEIDGVEKLVRATEEKVLSLEEEIEGGEKELSEREERLPRETEEHEEKLKDWRAEQQSINQELAAAEEEIRNLDAAIPPRERAEFHRLLDRKSGLAVVRVVDKSCSACHVKVRPAALQILKSGNELVYCDSCKRILYYDEQGS